MNTPAPCTICQSPEHKSRSCPELTKELVPGFYQPSGGMPQGEEENSVKKSESIKHFSICESILTSCFS